MIAIAGVLLLVLSALFCIGSPFVLWGAPLFWVLSILLFVLGVSVFDIGHPYFSSTLFWIAYVLLSSILHSIRIEKSDLFRTISILGYSVIAVMILLEVPFAGAFYAVFVFALFSWVK
eukprot:gnl/Spiro4/18455_TR9878_c0_g1_i1.p1 gnl/Spiro4/18455_TR9878_c0_g1~~gnl/Spiro4/18455_TR9878_c0_g1_i1.p1  ORF type:complete len:118 (+),score=34.76 gnl/Spiro4/18455_TR9878_c0_g1_i1:113-466(+)